MASIFGHAIASATLYNLYPYKEKRNTILLFSIFCSIIPDADVLMFQFGYHYEHWLGHRGFFHSILFCCILGFGLSFMFFNKKDNRLILGILFSLCALSHAGLDALTNGGRGVAFFAPFDNTRYFFPWRPILVSPLGVANFFSKWGIAVLKSEMVVILFPCIFLLVVNKFYETNLKKSTSKNNTSIEK